MVGYYDVTGMHGDVGWLASGLILFGGIFYLSVLLNVSVMIFIFHILSCVHVMTFFCKKNIGIDNNLIDYCIYLKMAI